MKRFHAKLELKNQIGRNGVGDGDGVRRGGEVLGGDLTQRYAPSKKCKRVEGAAGGSRACSCSSVGTSVGGDCGSWRGFRCFPLSIFITTESGKRARGRWPSRAVVGHSPH